MSRLTIALLMSAALFAPIGMQGQDHDDHDRDDHAQRYYDANHKDYHEWNANENKAYHEYWQHQHKKYRDYDKISKSQQQAYWDYRHEHPDNR